MRYRLIVLAMAALAAVCSGCSPEVETSASEPPVTLLAGDAPTTGLSDGDALTQFSLVTALAAGDYEGGASLHSLLNHGDFGVGTFGQLDGELILLNGKIYQALADGRVRAADLRGASPFAAVKFFHEDGRRENFTAATLDDLDERLDRTLPRRNAPYAVRIDGEFPELLLRSVAAQSPPFQPLVDVVKHQVTWQHHDLRGTLIGLRCPGWMGALNVEGYHWHFLSDDRQIGGHVLACSLSRGLLRFDECTSLVVQLPQSPQFDDFDVTQIGAGDIDRIERQRAPARQP